MYPWKRSLDQELKESGELVPKSQVLGLQKRVEELERVLGRKVLEVDLFKKSTSSRGSDYPRGQKMAGTERRLFGRVCVPDVQQASEVALLPPARRAGTGGQTQSALGLGYYGHSGLGWTEGALGDHDRLCGPDGAGLAFCQADHRRRPSRDVAGGGVLTVRRGARPSAGHQVPERQRAGIYLASVPAICEGYGIAPLPHTPTEPGVKRSGRGVLRQLLAGLRVPGLLGDLRDGGTADPRLDRPLQPTGAAQCAGDAVTRSVLGRLENQKHATTCPKLGGAVQSRY